MSEKLILTQLRKAVASLNDVAAQPKDEYIRDATIQRFEYTYLLAIDFLQDAKNLLEKLEALCDH